CRATSSAWNCPGGWPRPPRGRCSPPSPCSPRTACASTASRWWPSPPRRRRSPRRPPTSWPSTTRTCPAWSIPSRPSAPAPPPPHGGGNVLRRWHLRRGDVALGFRRAEVVVEHTYRTPFVDHAYLETETGVGWIDAEGVLTLRVSTQVLEHFRDVAEVLRLPH